MPARPAETAEPDTLSEFGPWEPLLRVVREAHPELSEWSATVGPGAMGGLPGPVGDPSEYYLKVMEAARPLNDAVTEAGRSDVSFSVRIGPGEHVLVTLAAESSSAAIHRNFGVNTAGHVVLTDDARPEPVRRTPQDYPELRPAASTDPAQLERVLRERMPDTVGASERDLAALEERLGEPLPPELRAVLRATPTAMSDSGPPDEDDEHRWERGVRALGGIELFELDGIEWASHADLRKGMPFDVMARSAVVTRPDAAVQGLVDSPRWLIIGDHGGGSGDWVAIDLAPGPAGHVGQLVVLDHESDIGAWLLAESFTGLVLDGPISPPRKNPGHEPPAVVMINSAENMTIEAAATSDLEVLQIGYWDNEQADLTPLLGLPRLRTLTAQPGKIADPLVIGGLDRLEYLEIGLTEWQALLAADAIPDTLLAAGISGYSLDRDQVDDVYDRLIRSRGGRALTAVTIEGRLS
ncbi:SMI1/KNR4 family protein [Promicromonospora vindobonensis]|uniref:SMI1/KNR4 family protein n=1 Tax=Promicromonospora vindobonensis TaxID=195748 RepID=A0ABW5VU91_9MICO